MVGFGERIGGLEELEYTTAVNKAAKGKEDKGTTKENVKEVTEEDERIAGTSRVIEDQTGEITTFLLFQPSLHMLTFKHSICSSNPLIILLRWLFILLLYCPLLLLLLFCCLICYCCILYCCLSDMIIRIRTICCLFIILWH